MRREDDRRLAAVVESVSDAFLSIGPDWRITYANGEAARLNGTTAAALLGRNHWEQWPETVGSEVERQYRRVAAEGVPARFVHHYPEADVWHAIAAYPAEGGGIAVFYHDVTAEKRAEAERERLLAAERAARAEAEAAREAAIAASRAKGDFLAVMSHELRTPLNAIGGYAQLMEMGLHGPITDQQREDLARIQKNQKHLLGLVNEVLNYARIETGAVRYAVDDVDLGEVAAAVEPLIRPQLDNRGVTLTTRVEGDARGEHVVARADGEKVRQILLNLLSNAVKFTERGGHIELSCDVDRSPTTDAPLVTVRVRDTGIGIPADQLERVFEPFVQVDARLTRTHEGTGLGLAISRDLARGMGGDLTLESAPGVGSTFTLTLPGGARGEGGGEGRRTSDDGVEDGHSA